jgi:uncharacterized membrane protein
MALQMHEERGAAMASGADLTPASQPNKRAEICGRCGKPVPSTLSFAGESRTKSYRVVFRGFAGGAFAMRVKVSALVGFSVVLALLGFATDRAQAQTFAFVVCNHTNVTASVATDSLVSPTDDRFVVQGWWSVPPQTCSTIGNFPQGWFYYYAEETNTQAVVWSGTALQLCVQHPGPFERINTANYTCGSNEVLRGFAATEVSSTTGTFTLNLN